MLSLEPYRLTGEVEYRDKPLGNATVALDGPAWTAELTTDQSGRFDAELWAPEDYGVMVTSGALAEPTDRSWNAPAPRTPTGAFAFLPERSRDGSSTPRAANRSSP